MENMSTKQKRFRSHSTNACYVHHDPSISETLVTEKPKKLLPTAMENILQQRFNLMPPKDLSNLIASRHNISQQLLQEQHSSNPAAQRKQQLSTILQDYIDYLEANRAELIKHSLVLIKDRNSSAWLVLNSCVYKDKNLSIYSEEDKTELLTVNDNYVDFLSGDENSEMLHYIFYNQPKILKYHHRHHPALKPYKLDVIFNNKKLNNSCKTMSKYLDLLKYMTDEEASVPENIAKFDKIDQYVDKLEKDLNICQFHLLRHQFQDLSTIYDKKFCDYRAALDAYYYEGEVYHNFSEAISRFESCMLACKSSLDILEHLYYPYMTPERDKSDITYIQDWRAGNNQEVSEILSVLEYNLNHMKVLNSNLKVILDSSDNLNELTDSRKTVTPKGDIVARDIGVNTDISIQDLPTQTEHRENIIHNFEDYRKYINLKRQNYHDKPKDVIFEPNSEVVHVSRETYHPSRATADLDECPNPVVHKFIMQTPQAKLICSRDGYLVDSKLNYQITHPMSSPNLKATFFSCFKGKPVCVIAKFYKNNSVRFGLNSECESTHQGNFVELFEIEKNGKMHNLFWTDPQLVGQAVNKLFNLPEDDLQLQEQFHAFCQKYITNLSDSFQRETNIPLVHHGKQYNYKSNHSDSYDDFDEFLDRLADISTPTTSSSSLGIDALAQNDDQPTPYIPQQVYELSWPNVDTPTIPSTPLELSEQQPCHTPTNQTKISLDSPRHSAGVSPTQDN